MDSLNKILIACVCAISFGAGFYITHNYYTNKIKEIEKQEILKSNEQLKKLNQINEEKATLEASLKQQEQQSYDKIKKLQDTNAAISNDIATYKRRLFVKVRDSGKTCLPENTASGISNGTASTVELDSGTSEQLVSITAKADKYKQQLEELQNYINKYNENVDILNKKIDTQYRK